jgi:Dolichyl-phosphate-mannose-protein mannosyltransferase
MRSLLVSLFPCLLVLALALALRLLVWQWHRFYDLGGDEREYFEQALTLLREHRYVELKLMRPPLYTGFLAACIYLFDSLVQRLRLIQELVGVLTVVPAYALTRQLFGDQRVAFVAGLLVAANYTLAANATELLTETLFLFGLTTLFWLLLKAGGPTTIARRPLRHSGSRACRGAGQATPDGRQLQTDLTTHNTQYPIRFMFYSALAGLTLGALALLRSVALPLLPLGALWLLVRTDESPSPIASSQLRSATDQGPQTPDRQSDIQHTRRKRLLCSLLFVLCAILVIAPWTIRNYATYGAPILIDTTGPENLWLDNDPAGRDAVKRQLYDLGDHRAARQRLALARGAAVVAADPARFFAKAWGEAQKFFALQYFDDMRERREIWLPPAEVGLRLLLGDGVWLVLVLGGAVGLWLVQEPRTKNRGQNIGATMAALAAWFSDARWLFVPWALYTLLTALVFHVELRYRLPLYPVLLPYAAWTLVRIADCRLQIADWAKIQTKIKNQRLKVTFGFLSCTLMIGLALLHRPYLLEAWRLAWKHAQLWRAERALTSGDAAGAQAAAQAALDWDDESALARVSLARAALLAGDQPRAIGWLGAAIDVLPAHPHAHLLRGAILRAQGQAQPALRDLAFERNSLEDLQGWALRAFASFAPVPAVVEVGGGLDLGFVRGFSQAEQGAFRWSSAESQVGLLVPPAAARLDLRLAAGRPAGAPPATLVVLVDGRELGRIQLQSGWRTYSLPLSQPPGPLVLTLRSDTFRPRDYDRVSPDDRALGVMVARVAIVAP